MAPHPSSAARCCRRSRGTARRPLSQGPPIAEGGGAGWGCASGWMSANRHLFRPNGARVQPPDGGRGALPASLALGALAELLFEPLQDLADPRCAPGARPRGIRAPPTHMMVRWVPPDPHCLHAQDSHGCTIRSPCARPPPTPALRLPCVWELLSRLTHEMLLQLGSVSHALAKQKRLTPAVVARPAPGGSNPARPLQTRRKGGRHPGSGSALPHPPSPAAERSRMGWNTIHDH